MCKKTTDLEKIFQILSKINEAWTKGDPDDLAQYFHEELVIIGPDLRRMGEGKKDCVKSYKEFAAQANVREYREKDHTIDVWGNTAVVTYAFDIFYEMNGQTFRESGHDMFVFNREGELWFAVWRMVLPSLTNN